MELPGNRSALLIGMDPSIGKSRSDAEVRLEGLRVPLLDPDIGDYDEVDLLVNATPAETLAQLDRFCGKARDDTTLLVLYRGAALTDGSGAFFLATPLTHPERLDESALQLQAVIDRVSQSNAHGVAVLLDCWYSGPVVIEDNPPFQQTGPEPDVAVLFDLRHSLAQDLRPRGVSEVLREALTGHTPVDTDSDGLIEIGDLYHELRPYHSPVEHRLEDRDQVVLVRGSTTPLYLARAPQPRPPESLAQPANQVSTATDTGGEEKRAAEPVTAEPVDDDVEWVSDAPAREDLLQREALADV
ncbi:MAG: hypothetical protein ACRDT6_10605 [Micromonosporaceae bacterium]